MKRKASIVLRALRVAAVRLRFIVLVAMAVLLGAVAEDLWALARSVLAPARLSRAAGGWLYICPMHPAVVRALKAERKTEECRRSAQGAGSTARPSAV